MLPFDREYDHHNLTALIFKGSFEALQQFLTIHQQFIYNVALRMLNNEHTAKIITEKLTIKLLLNIRKPHGYMQIIADIRKKATQQSFEALAARISQESLQPPMACTAQEIATVQHACLTSMLACLSVERRCIFILSGIFNLPADTVSGLLNRSVEVIQHELLESTSEIGTFISGNCSLLGHHNPCTCAKRARFLHNKHLMSPYKIEELINTQTDNELIRLYQRQPYLNGHCADRLIKMFKTQIA